MGIRTDEFADPLTVGFVVVVVLAPSSSSPEAISDDDLDSFSDWNQDSFKGPKDDTISLCCLSHNVDEVAVAGLKDTVEVDDDDDDDDSIGRAAFNLS
jgi:hypothetical protein